MFINMLSTSLDLSPTSERLVLQKEANVKRFNRALQKKGQSHIPASVCRGGGGGGQCFHIIFHLTTLEYHNEIFNHMNISH